MPQQGKGTHCYAADPHWWLYHIDAVLDNYQGECWTQDRNWKPGQAEEFGLNVIPSKEHPGLSRSDDLIHTGRNSGYQGIGLAYRLAGYQPCTIILLGFNMCRPGGKAHWFGDHPKAFNTQANYEQFISSFKTIKCEDYGIDIINCTPQTALDCFPVCNLDDVL